MPQSQLSRSLVALLLLAVLVLAAALRLQAISTTVVDTPIRADAKVYYNSALNLQRWGVFSSAPPAKQAPAPDAFVQPLMPWMASSVVDRYASERMLLRFNTLQAVLGVFTVLLTFWLFAGLAHPLVGVGAALLTALSPHLIVMSTYFLTETLFTFLLVAALGGLVQAVRRSSAGWACVGGVLLGLTALTRATTEYAPLLMVGAVLPFATRRQWLTLLLPAALAGLAVVLGWKLRNWAVVGAVSDPTLMVNTVLHGAYPDFMFNGLEASHGAPYRYDPFAQQGGYDMAAVLQEVWRRVVQDPVTYLYWYLAGKPISLLSWNMIDGMGDVFIYPVLESPYFDNFYFAISRWGMQHIHAPLSVLAVVGGVSLLWKAGALGLSSTQRLMLAWLVALFGYFFLIHAVGAPFPRYGIPLRPFVYGLAVWVLWVAGQQTVKWWQSRKVPA